MYTSYYACKEIYDQSNLISISLSITPGIQELIHQRQLNITRCKQLAPSWDILSAYKQKQISSEEYVIRYKNEILKTLDPHKLYTILGHNAVLLCYEKPTDFCHRHIVSEWFRSAGYDCREYKHKTTQDNIIEAEWEF